MPLHTPHRHLLFSTHPGHLQSHQQAHGGMKTGVYLLSELTGPERAPQPHAHTHYRTKDSFLVGVECELVVLLGRAWHINVFQPLQHRTAFQVFWFDYVNCHKEPAGEKDEVKAERIPIGYPSCGGTTQPVSSSVPHAEGTSFLGSLQPGQEQAEGGSYQC